jgi:hypothetical protein
MLCTCCLRRRCVSPDLLKTIGSPERLVGLGQLSFQDQQRVLRAFAQGRVPEYTEASDLVGACKLLCSYAGGFASVHVAL